MRGMRRWNRWKRTATMAVLVSALILAGCGRETPGSGEETVGSTGEAPDQTVSAEVQGSEADKQEAERSFQYDAIRLYGGVGGLPPVIGEEQAVAEGRTVVTLQTSWVNAWLKYSVAGFNRQSEEYFIKIDRDGDEDRLSVELMAGRGPDIIGGDMLEAGESILKKGVVVDLASGLDAMGITDEDYFPSVRALRMGEGVYGICPFASPTGLWIRESVLGSREKPDIETLVEKLYTYPDQEAVWWTNAKPEFILEHLLSGSQDLWGMIDWESGTCDFSGELFAKILEVTKRYADPDGKGDLEKNIVFFYTPTNDSPKELENEGKVIIDFLFDDGNYPYYDTGLNVLMLNANSQHLEGAWKFVEYLLGEDGQGYATSMMGTSANREMARSFAAYELKMLEEGRMETTADITPEAFEELFAYADRARYVPLRTKDILKIIYEEAQTFCSGGKSLEEVRSVIQNRVQLYISETM
ncbi:MAG: ABC transporter substrate-binding protein [bacterium]|nr:ABC transporter substrate-binding protein [bacterium]